MTWRILEGDARSVLATLPAESAHCVTTSPPYFGLRNYQVDGQIGLESSPEAYVDALVAVFREVKRVLHPSGTLWLNLGDSYNGSGGSGGDYRNGGLKDGQPRYPGHDVQGLKPKDMIGIPWMTAFALRADGWYLRQDIIWHKKSCMPESVTDRCTKSHEYIFMLTKSRQYYYDWMAIAEPALLTGGAAAKSSIYGPKNAQNGGRESSGLGLEWTNPFRNRRDVWMLGPEPFKGAHYATFPTEIPRLCISAGSSEHGVCSKCGAPWERVIEHKPMQIRKSGRGDAMGEHGRTAASGTMLSQAENVTVGWRPTCDHDAPIVSATVLDPFSGAGTTVMVAQRLGRDGIGIELNPEYAAMSRARITGDCPMFNGEEVA